MPNFLLTNANRIVNKFDELDSIIRMYNIDFACITESWLNNSIPHDYANINGYVCYRHDRQDGRQGGGVICYVRNDVPCTRLEQLETPNVESLWLLFRGKRMTRTVSHVAVGIIYHPPNGDRAAMVGHILECLDRISQKHPHSGIVLLGDFNRLADSAILSYPLKQIVKVATRGVATLDKIYTNIQDLYNQPISLPPIGKSDHNTVIMQGKQQQRMLYKEPYVYQLVRSKDHNNKVLLAHALNSFNWSTMYRLNKCEEMLDYLYTVVYGLLDVHLPLRLVRKHVNDKPWIDNNFRSLIRRRQFAWTHQNWTEYRLYRNKVQRAASFLRTNYYRKRAQGLRKCKPRNWWQEIKRFTGQSSRHPLGAMASEQFDDDTNRMANDINIFLQSVSSDLKSLDGDLIPDITANCPDEYIIHPFEVERRLASVDAHKPCGPDEIPNWFLREFSVWLAEPICAVFNASVREGVVPCQWKLANVVPIPKVTPPKDISKDLRPISLTSTISKILEGFVGRWIMERILGKLDARQYGCLKGKSTTHELVDILHHWHQALDNGQCVRALFIDYAKAFDHVDHSLVIRKLRALDVPDILLRWMCSFLSNRQQRVKLFNVLSDWLELTGAMPQGSYLGPLTFIVLINDLVASCSVHKFVDDTTLTEILAKNQSSCMDVYLSEVLKWSAANLMNVNLSKTKEMLIGTFSNQPTALSFNNNIIERVSVFKLLGVLVDCSLKWDSHVHSICAKASSRLFFLKQLKRNSISSEDLLYFYTAAIRPVLEYACPVWHTSLTQKLSHNIERVQKRALTIIYGPQDYDILCITCNISSLFERRETLCKQFFKSILNQSSCLHYLLPDPRNCIIKSKLRSSNNYVATTTRTDRFKNSFIQYALNNYQ